jgi:hypothetical protein
VAKLRHIRSRFPSVVYREHCLQRIAERNIDPAIIKEATFRRSAEVIECYPNDPRGASCLMLGWWNRRKPLHVIYGLKSRLSVVTVYDPSASPDQWESDFKTRK